MSAAMFHTECVHSRSTVPVVFWWYIRRIPNTRYSELPYQYNIRLCCLFTS